MVENKKFYNTRVGVNVMKYSIIIPYRNRKSHLSMLLPRLLEKFSGTDFEIIVSEQNNDDAFRIACLENIGFMKSTGDIIILHQVDYYPLDDVSYEVNESPVLPARKGIFLNKDSKTVRDTSDIPAGYKNWSEEIDPRFYGGVVCMKREHFEKINGLNPKYVGWGNEDEDLRERFVWADLPTKRNKDGTFLCLYHEDAGDMNKMNELSLKNFKDGRAYLHTRAYKERHIGYKNLLADIEEFDAQLPHVKWIKSTNYRIEDTWNNVSDDFANWSYLLSNYVDEESVHKNIWLTFKNHVNANIELKQHRDYIVKTRSGYGNRAFHWMWKLLVDQMPEQFTFLEIGVFMGQITSLIQTLATRNEKKVMIYGITPLDNTDNHPDKNYLLEIERVYRDLKISMNNTQIIKGLSTEESVIQKAIEKTPLGGYDMIFIDGGHTFSVVSSDIKNYKELVKVGGYLIMDDASNYLKIPNGLLRMDWKGIPEVSEAVKQYLESDHRFTHLFAVGHNRVFQRTEM